MVFEEELVKFMKKSPLGQEYEYGMSMKYWALDLITEPFDYSVLAKKAKEEDINHRLGRLCEVAAQAAELKGLEGAKKLYQLVEELYTPPTRWQYLDHYLPEFGRRMISSSPQTDLNKKWKVYSTLKSKDIIDWIELYITQEHATPPKRPSP